MFGRFPFCVDDSKTLKESPHSIVDFVAEFLANVDMVMKARGEVTKHRIDASWQCHQVAWVRRHDFIDAPSQVVQRDVHVQRCANVESDHQPMQFAHDNVFQTATDELFPGTKDFRANESCYVIQMHPRRLSDSIRVILVCHCLCK